MGDTNGYELTARSFEKDGYSKLDIRQVSTLPLYTGYVIPINEDDQIAFISMPGENILIRNPDLQKVVPEIGEFLSEYYDKDHLYNYRDINTLDKAISWMREIEDTLNGVSSISRMVRGNNPMIIKHDKGGNLQLEMGGIALLTRDKYSFGINGEIFEQNNQQPENLAIFLLLANFFKHVYDREIAMDKYISDKRK